jgi:polygalacturonase
MPLIGAHDADHRTRNVGDGRLRCLGKAYGAPAIEVRDDSGNANGPAWDHLLKALEARQPVTEAEYQAATKELRPSFICFENSKNVLVEGLHLVGGPAFVIHLSYTENATARNVLVEAYPGPHVNGIVVDSSRFVRIANDYIDTGDDGIVIKAGKDADGLRVNRPSEDVAITDCTVHHAHGAVVIAARPQAAFVTWWRAILRRWVRRTESASRAGEDAAAWWRMYDSTTGRWKMWALELS